VPSPSRLEVRAQSSPPSNSSGVHGFHCSPRKVEQSSRVDNFILVQGKKAAEFMRSVLSPKPHGDEGKALEDMNSLSWQDSDGEWNHVERDDFISFFERHYQTIRRKSSLPPPTASASSRRAKWIALLASGVNLNPHSS